jgi:uncharacterized protein (DUF1778 family)|tara:strand:- start:624 stop:1004 length:381 start_codon:yes stop_codon:yes gene_type:complete
MSPFWRQNDKLLLSIIFRFRKEFEMTAVKQTERVSARIPQHVFERLTEAAHVVGATLNQFLVQSALEKAEKLLEQERVIQMSQRDAELFFETVENPPPINKKLLEAMDAYQENFPNVENRGTQPKT